VVFVCGTFGALACDPHQQTCRSFAATPCSLVVYEPDAAIIGLLHRSGEVSLYEWPSLRVQRIIKAKSEIKFFSFVPKTGRIAALSGRRLKAMGAGDARGALAASEQLAEAERAAGRTFAEELLGR
jgi:hypothetical protein